MSPLGDSFLFQNLPGGYIVAGCHVMLHRRDIMMMIIKVMVHTSYQVRATEKIHGYSYISIPRNVSPRLQFVRIIPSQLIIL